MADTFTDGEWRLGSVAEQRQQAVMGGICIRAYSRRHDDWLTIYQIKPHEMFGGLDAAMRHAAEMVEDHNAKHAMPAAA